MSTVIIIVIAVAIALAVAWVLARWHRARRHQEVDDVMARDLFNRYLADVDTFTQAYLLHAPSDEEWLAASKWELARPLSSEQQQRRLAQQKAELEEVLRRNEEAFELERRRHEQDLAQMRQELTRMQEQFEQQLEQRKATHDQSIRTASFQHAAGEAARLKESLGADESEMTTVFAGAIGEGSISATADLLNADRERRRAQGAEDELRKQERVREEARYGRQFARENRQMEYDLEVQRLKAQADVVVAAVNRGLADHQNFEYLMTELKHVAKQLEGASSSAQHQETDQGVNPEQPKRSERAQRSPRPERCEVQDHDRVIEAQIVSDDSAAGSDDAEPELREEDLGR